MSIGPPILEVQHFQNLTLKIRGQGHGWRHSLKSQCGSNILSTHIPFVPCQSGIPFLSYVFFQNLTLKIKGQGHGWGHSSKSQCGPKILSTHIPFVPCQSALPFLRYSIFKIWPWKSRVKVMGEVTIQSHNVGLAYYRLTSHSFHANLPSHSWQIWPRKSRVKVRAVTSTDFRNRLTGPPNSNRIRLTEQFTSPYGALCFHVFTGSDSLSGPSRLSWQVVSLLVSNQISFMQIKQRSKIITCDVLMHINKSLTWCHSPTMSSRIKQGKESSYSHLHNQRS